MQHLAEDDSRLVFMKEEDVLKTKGLNRAYHNYWWAVHPEKGLVFFTHSRDISQSFVQANMNEDVTKSLVEKMYPWAEVKQFDLVLAPTNE